jgi:hypothetical protein
LQSSLASGIQLPWQAFVNDLADHLADKAAKACQVADTEVYHLRKLDEKALDIIKRLVAVHELYSQKSTDDQVAPHHNFLPLNPIITNLHGGSGSNSDDRANALSNPSLTSFPSGSEQGSSEARIHSLPSSDSTGLYLVLLRPWFLRLIGLSTFSETPHIVPSKRAPFISALGVLQSAPLQVLV